MLAHLSDPDVLPLILQLQIRMPDHRFIHLFRRGSFRQGALLQIPQYLSEYPGIPLCRPCDHDAVASRFLEHMLRTDTVCHIPVTDNRDLQCLFDLTDNMPVCAAVVILFPCPAMYGYCSGPAFLRRKRTLDCIDALLCESLPDLDRNRSVCRLTDRLHDLLDQSGILHQCRAFSVPDYFGNRAAHVDIQHVIICFLQHTDCLGHYGRFGSEQLQRDRMLLRVYLQEHLCIPVMIGNCLGTDHFHAHKSRSLLMAEQTKWQVTYPCHRSQYNIIGKRYASDL